MKLSNIIAPLVIGLAGVLYSGDSLGADIVVPKVGKVDLSSKIIPNGHFTWAEATKNGTRIPENEEVAENIVNTAKVMEEIRTLFGNKPIRVNSWYRTSEANYGVGAPKSRHMKGDAVDIVVSGVSSEKVYEKLDKYLADRGGLGKYPGRTHVDFRGYKARWEGK